MQKAEKLAQQYELHAGMVEIGTWKRKLEQAQAPHNYDAFLESIAGQKKAIDLLENTNRYWALAVHVSKETIARNTDPVENDSLLEDLENARSLEAKVLHYNATYFQCLGRREHKKAERVLYSLLTHLENHPKRINEDPGLYASSVNNLVSFLVFQKKYEQALDLVQRAKNRYRQWNITSERKTLFKQIMRTYNIELEIYRDTRTFEKNESFISGIEKFVIDNRYKMPKSYVLSFWFQLANIHFMQRNFDKSLEWINEILNTKHKDSRIDLQIHARMMNLMIHLERQNFFVLRYFVDSTRRFLKKKRHVAPHEAILLKFFSSIAQAPVMEYRQKFEALHAALFPPEAPPLIDDTLDYIDYRLWISAHLST